MDYKYETPHGKLIRIRNFLNALAEQAPDDMLRREVANELDSIVKSQQMDAVMAADHRKLCREENLMKCAEAILPHLIQSKSCCTEADGRPDIPFMVKTAFEIAEAMHARCDALCEQVLKNRERAENDLDRLRKL